MARVITLETDGSKGTLDTSIFSGGTSSLIGEAIISFPITTEENISKVTIPSLLITNSNFKSFNYFPLVSTDHQSLDDFDWDNLSFKIQNIIDQFSFDIVAIAQNQTWGDYNIKYIITWQIQ